MLNNDCSGLADNYTKETRHFTTLHPGGELKGALKMHKIDTHILPSYRATPAP